MGNINTSVDLRRDGDIVVVTADNPPVNALKHEVRAGLVEALNRVRDDAAVKGVVIACAGRTFFAGADITEFGKPPQPPSLHDIIAAIEAMPKPVVAALHGTALGGGFELALACHFRVAVPGARVGLPEVKLGLLPGAGGTQRLPRLVGPEKALQMIVTGEPIGAAEARGDGIIDEIVEGDLTAAAIDFARRVVREGRPLRLVRNREEKLVAEGFADAAETLTRRLRGRDAPAACVEAVRNAIVLPFEEGLKREAELFRKLVAGAQSKAQRHIFFAEREAAKVPGIPEGTKPRPIASGAVIGAGTMGGGIAMCFANAGIPVTIVETGRDLLQKGLDRVAANYRATVSRGGLSADEMERRIGLITGVTELEAVGAADVVIEAVFEEMDLKRRVFSDLDRVAKSNALLATNTSTLDVDEIARATKRPQDVLGTHFFSPANVMRLLEIVRGAATAPDVDDILLESSSRLGVNRRPMPQEEIGERRIFPMINEGARILEEGIATRPGDIDVIWVYGYGWPVWRGGPMYYADRLGLPHIRDRLSFYADRSRDETLRPAPLLQRLAAEGRGFAS